MGNMIDYVIEKGADSFDDRPFCKEDALVLAEFSYLNFDKLMEPVSEACLSLDDLKASDNFESLFSNYAYGKLYRDLFDAMYGSERFGKIKSSFFINYVNSKDGIQFCAITFILPGGITFIAFRGTDETVVGWQEDFRLALAKPVPGQKLSTKYVNDVANRIGGKFMMGGHSKGGNLAMYAAMNCSDAIKERISTIYSFDGPGFRPEILKQNNYASIKAKTVSVIPKSSMVGLVLATDENSIVVASKSVGIFQHDPLNWIIQDGKLVETKLTEQHLLMINTFNEWLFSLDEEHLNVFISMLVESLNATEATTTDELTADIPKSLGKMMQVTKAQDEETRKIIDELKKSFFSLAYSNVVNEVSTMMGSKKDEMMKLIADVKKSFEKNKKKPEK